MRHVPLAVLLRRALLPALVVTAMAALSWRASPARAAEARHALDYLNRLRQSAGLVPLSHNPVLDRSSQGHADYLSWNKAVGHGEQPGRRGYTGREPAARVRKAGYPHQWVAENVSAGEATAEAAVDGLMAAIYHRLGFLTFELDEVGVGLRMEPGRQRYVFNLGHAGLARTCTERPAEARYHPPGSYYTPCGDDFPVAQAYYEAQRTSVARRNPRVVLWPPADAHDIPPAFFNESPDPLPDYAVSGYPVSVQFNPVRVKSASLKSFRLFAEAGPGTGPIDDARLTELRNTRRFTQRSDPHRKFGPLEFALFPLERLLWGHGYVADVTAEVDGREERLRWRFRTRDAGAPLYVAEGRGEVLPVVAGRTYAIYLPPTRKAPTLGRIQYSGAEAVKPTVDFVDGNTLRVQVTGPLCASLNARLADGRRFTLRLAEQDTTAGPVPDAVLYARCPEFSADFRIQARGEVLPMVAGRAYLVHVAPTARHPRLTGFRYRTVAGVKPHIEFASPDSLRIRVDGDRCSTVSLEFNDGRKFRVQVAGADGRRGDALPPGGKVRGC